MNQEKTVFDKYISQSKKKNRIGCLSLVLLISGCSSLITYHPGGANVVIGLLLLVGGGYLLWNYVIKPYFKPDNVFFDQVRDDLEKWARGEVEASYEKVFEVIKAPYVFGLNASYEHDKVDDKSELDIPLINYVEHIKEGDQKRVSKVIMLSWKMTIKPSETQEYFHLARKDMVNNNTLDTDNNPFIYANDSKYYFFPINNTEMGDVDITTLMPLSNDYFSSSLLENGAMDSKNFLFRIYLDDGTHEDIEYGAFEKDNRYKIVNGLWLANLFSTAAKQKSPLRNFVDKIQNNNDESEVKQEMESSDSIQQLKTGFDTEEFSLDSFQNAFESIKKENDEE